MAAEGSRALSEGDTILARQKYTEAGDILKKASEATRKSAAKQHLRFLAASQYFRGGEYAKAIKVCRRVDCGHLPVADQRLFDDFYRTVKARTDPNYLQRLRSTVHSMREKGEAERAIELLKDNPYIWERSWLAWTRTDLCLRSGQIKAAVLFSADAVRFSNFHPKLVFLRAGASTFLNSIGKSDEATEFLRLVQSKEPTALDWVAVCYDLYDKLEQGKGDPDAGRELLRLMDLAQLGFTQLPADTVADTDVRNAMAHGFLLAAIAADLLRSRQEAMKYVNAGEELQAHQIISEIFRRLRVAADEVWIHSPDLALQLAKISIQLDSRRDQAEQSMLSTAA